MTGLDDQLVGLGAGGGTLAIALVVAVLLGLRHATDPDHVTALSTLTLGDEERSAAKAGRLGLAWGAGHALTLVLLGLPVVLGDGALPGWAQRAAEGLVGAVIAVLAARLLVRWRRGAFGPREHRDAEAAGRSPRAAFGIGLLHGAGGSAGVGILLIAGIDRDVEAAAALLLFATGAAASMALASAAWGRLLVSGAVERRLGLLAPAFGAAGLAFGCWYGAVAVT